MKRVIKIFVTVICTAIVSAIIFVSFRLNYQMTLFDASVLRTFAWACFAVAITLLGTYIAQKARIKKQLTDYNCVRKDEVNYKKIIAYYDKGQLELTENVIVLILCALLMYAIDPIAEIDIPNMAWPFGFEKMQAVAYIKFTCLMITTLAVLDTLISSVITLSSSVYELINFE